MNGKLKRAAAAVTVCCLLGTALTGCWDDHELDTIFIVTGAALDAAQETGKVTLSLQAGKVEPSAAKLESSGGGSTTLLFKCTGETPLRCLNMLNRDSSRTLYLHHNQVILLGREFAENGVLGDMDLFVRSPESREATPVMVVDGRAEDVLTARLEQEKISGIFLAHMFQDLSAVTPHYTTRLLDFMAAVLSRTTCPVLPIIALYDYGTYKEIKHEGLAIFKEGRMTGRLNSEEMQGYTWALGAVKKGSVSAACSDGKMVFGIIRLKSKPSFSFREDGGVRQTLTVTVRLRIDELSGFEGVPPEELVARAAGLAEATIRNRIDSVLRKTQALGTDIFGFGCAIRRKAPARWKAMEDNWDQYYREMETSVTVKAEIAGTGQIVESLEQEAEKDEAR